ncbi:MAG: DUF6783 domain-containing protein [Blautia faecis]|uniref:DUF6783 domain-containing protein n=1 Tax=Blautia faecis TaxID=871665 RepID=UPI003A219366
MRTRFHKIHNWSLFEKSFPQSPTNCDAHLAESLFQTRSSTERTIHVQYTDCG